MEVKWDVDKGEQRSQSKEKVAETYHSFWIDKMCGKPNFRWLFFIVWRKHSSQWTGLPHVFLVEKKDASFCIKLLCTWQKTHHISWGFLSLQEASSKCIRHISRPRFLPQKVNTVWPLSRRESSSDLSIGRSPLANLRPVILHAFFGSSLSSWIQALGWVPALK